MTEIDEQLNKNDVKDMLVSAAVGVLIGLFIILGLAIWEYVNEDSYSSLEDVCSSGGYLLDSMPNHIGLHYCIDPTTDKVKQVIRIDPSNTILWVQNVTGAYYE